MRSIRFALAWLALAWSVAAQADGPVRVLFIGNSFTAINDVPALTARLAASARPPIAMETEFVGEGGATLQRHWEAGRALEAIRRGGWRFVVLQDQGALGHYDDGSAPPRVADPARFHEYARRFDAEIRKAGGRTVLLMTWARLDAPETQAVLARAYEDIGAELKAAVIPAGIAWHLALAERPAMRLHHSDRSHPAAAGSYLAACAIYAALSGRTPEGLSGDALVSDEDAAFLQRIAWRALRERPPLVVPTAIASAAPGSAAAGDEARGLAVFAAAQKAFGGIERLRALKDYSIDLTSKVHTPMGAMTLDVKETFVFPGAVRNEMRTPMGSIVSFFDGTDGWRQTPQGFQEMPDRFRRLSRAQAIRNTLSLLRGEGSMAVRHEGRESLAGADADVIVVSKEGETVRLVVDAASGILLRKRYRGVGSGGAADIEEAYEDYREVAGVRLPFRVETTQNGAPFMQATVRSARFDTGIERAELARRPD
jgi:hypothetical protein